MPIQPRPTAPATGGLRSRPGMGDDTSPDVPAVDATADDSGPGSGTILAALAGALGLAGAAYLGKNEGVVGKIASYANAVRQQLMLSGLAAPKSMLGNVGAAAIASAEGGTMAPLKALFSGQTLEDIKTAWKANPSAIPGATSLPDWLPTPGRVMGSLDEATQKALVRGGLSADDAEKALLQTPLGGKMINGEYDKRFGGLGDVMQSPTANYVFPFRRVPFNQLYEGLDTLKPANIAKNPGTTAAIGALGAAHGAATADDKYPTSLPLGVAASGRYGVPYGLAALAGRAIKTSLDTGAGGGGGIGGAILPVSEYGVEQATDPLAPIQSPAALRALQKFGIVNNPNLW